MGHPGYPILPVSTLQDAAVATGNGVITFLRGYSGVVVQLKGTFSATVTFEASLDGTTWVAIEGINANDNTKSSTATAPGIWVVPIPGGEQFRARISAYTSGSVTVLGRACEDVTQPYDVELTTGDVEIGAVEIKNASDDTRATVGANGLHVDVRAIQAGTNNIGDVDVVTDPAYGTVAVGELAGSATAVQMPSVACRLVKFKAAFDNAGRVYIGGSGVTVKDGTTDTTTGLELSAGEETGWIPITNLNLLYRIANNAGDDLTYIALS